MAHSLDEILENEKPEIVEKVRLMAIQEYDNEADFDAAFERIEELSFDKMGLEADVKEAQRALEEAEERLDEFITNHPDII